MQGRVKGQHIEKSEPRFRLKLLSSLEGASLWTGIRNAESKSIDDYVKACQFEVNVNVKGN
jgi:hypothetical protein